MVASAKIVLRQHIKVVLSLYSTVHTAPTDAPFLAIHKDKQQTEWTACAMCQNMNVKGER